jgi:hypothetical protein
MSALVLSLDRLDLVSWKAYPMVGCRESMLHLTPDVTLLTLLLPPVPNSLDAGEFSPRDVCRIVGIHVAV